MYQLTSVISGGVAPSIATLLLARSGTSAVAGYVAACCAITVIAAVLAPETRRTRLEAPGRSLAESQSH